MGKLKYELWGYIYIIEGIRLWVWEISLLNIWSVEGISGCGRLS